MQQSTEMFTDGAAYERLMGRWSQKVGQQFLDWLAVAPGQDWLDVGCGNGAFTAVIRSRDATARLTGIDPSEAQIAHARQRPDCQGATFIVGDAQNLPFAEASFDAAVMALVIAFVPDPALGVRELARVTRPGGHCAAYMWDFVANGIPLAPLYRALRALGHSAPLPPSAAKATSDGLRQLWQAAGLEAVAQEAIRITVTFDDFDDFWQSNSRPAGPLLQIMTNLSAAEEDAVRAHLRANLPTDAQGRISYQAVANAVKGRRPA